MKGRLAVSAAFVLFNPSLASGQGAPSAATVEIAPDPQAAGQLNPTGKPVVLTAPVMDGSTYLGDATITIEADERVHFSARRLLDLLKNRVDAGALQTLESAVAGGRPLTASEFQRAGILIRYNPQALELQLDIAPGSRASRSLALSDIDDGPTGSFIAPADYSAYVSVRGSLDYVHQGADRGLDLPVIFIDGAARVRGIVIESEANYQPGARDADFQRRGTRAVYDDQDRLMRWSAGDLLTLGRGFQSAPEIAGLALYRSYSVLEPQAIIRPRGDRSFRLDRRSSVEVSVNNQIVRRIELDPGSYDLRDFPFTQGANDIRLTITDDAGRSETVRYNIFLDQAQLARGLSEFGLYAGVIAPLGRNGPRYSDDLAFTGFYRRGMSDTLTLGANVQVDPYGWMGGPEAVLATPIGSFAGFLAASQVEGYGKGWASILTFQRPVLRANGLSNSFSLSLEARSRDFGPIGTLRPFNPFVYEIGGGYSRSINEDIYAGVDARYSKGRGDQRDVASLRATMGWRINAALNFTGDARYERDAFGTEVGAFLSLTYRLGRYSSLRGDYDPRFNRARLTYQTYRGSGVGAYNFNADIERSDGGVGATVNANYFANRAELGFSHFGTFDGEFGPSTSQRSSLRFGTAVGVADGAVSWGRPVYDSFAVVQAHRSLKGADVVLDPSPSGATAHTGALGTALYSSLTSYSERSITVDAPAAPTGADLGQGAFRLFPPYRAGYKLTVGSDYSVTVVGRLVTRDGSPVSLVAGTATELAQPDREPVTLFTNGDGRFGATGLAPGRWRIEMLDPDRSIFEIEIADEAEGVIQLGEVRPSS
ncbi:fimbrial biogenesis outer membrane usher protein [Allosphingosinicella vermicomposti]|uniref:fimbrial biogenesis outer membrane usher protein n=1 Tax=Allosphingosinicella vermicomposti TaxID=614671 RepID=UPI000D0ED294|nr:fimbrial biogenesis outer membrane usher protein [Allosphingosinicella vermicomposti]